MFVDDLMADVLKLLIYLAVSMMLVYSRQYLVVRACSPASSWCCPCLPRWHDGDGVGQTTS